MKKVILMLFVLGFIGMNGYAQKVYKKDGKVYLECTEATGMPAGSVTTTPKCIGGEASNTTYRDGFDSTNLYAWENDKVFEKLEIDYADMAKPGEPTDWKTAYDGCKSKNTGGITGWRLPTQRELMLMYIFRVQLGEMTGNNFDSYAYWSSLEYSSYNSYSSWSVSFTNGTTLINDKADSNGVRCVREVAPKAA